MGAEGIAGIYNFNTFLAGLGAPCVLVNSAIKLLGGGIIDQLFGGGFFRWWLRSLPIIPRLCQAG